MGLELTIALALGAAAVGGFCAWMGARPVKPMSAPRLVPWRILMLFAVAFSIGQHSAAKLVHFGFLLATMPLLLRIGRRLRRRFGLQRGLAPDAALAPPPGVVARPARRRAR